MGYEQKVGTLKSQFKLSPTILNLFLECPRCFWLDRVKSVKRPRGIFPSLPSGMDRVIKIYFDGFRMKHQLPPELRVDGFEGIQLYENLKQLELWRNWRTGLVYQDGEQVSLSGALDDLMSKDGKYIPLDYKTKGSPTTVEDAVKYYNLQLNCYSLLLEANHLPTAGFGFLIYYTPERMGENGAAFFKLQAIKIKTDPDHAKETLKKAVACLLTPIPAHAGRCEYCAWLADVQAAVS